MSEDKLKVLLIALLIHSWWIIPVTGLIFVTIRDRFKDAKENGESVGFVFGRAFSGCVGLLVKGLLVFAVLVILVKACDVIDGPTYEPEYEAWRR